MNIGEILEEIEVLPEEIDLGDEVPEEPGIGEPEAVPVGVGADVELNAQLDHCQRLLDELQHEPWWAVMFRKVGPWHSDSCP